MLDPEELEKYDWGRIHERLERFAYARLGSRGTWQDAEEMAQEAIKRVFDPAYADYDPAGGSLLLHLGSVVNGMIQNRTRTKSITRAVLVDPLVSLAFERNADRVPSPESAAIQAEHDAVGRRALKLLTERIPSGDFAEDILLQEWLGVRDPKSQAANLGQPIKDVYNARRRLLGHYEAVGRQLVEEGFDV